MKSGAPAFGTPEYVRATQMSGQMARYYGLPLRASNACAANAPDAQAAWESANSLWACVTVQGERRLPRRRLARGRADRLLREVRDGLRDAAAVDALHEADPARPTTTSRSTPSRAVGPRSHFFGAEHTQAATRRRSTARSSPTGATTRPGRRPARCKTPERANKIWKQILAEFEPPPMDPAIAEELSDFVERRKREGGAPTDFYASCFYS